MGYKMVVRLFAPEAGPRVLYHRRRSPRYSEGRGSWFIQDGRLDIRRSPVYSEKVARVFVDNGAGEGVVHTSHAHPWATPPPAGGLERTQPPALLSRARGGCVRVGSPWASEGIQSS